MNILVTNDDGYTSPGLANLAVSMRAFGNVDVIAPKDDRSGSSCSITLDRPLTSWEGGKWFRFCEWYTRRLRQLGSNSALKEQAFFNCLGHK